MTILSYSVEHMEQVVERMKLISKTFSLNFVKLPCMHKFIINNYHQHHVPTTVLTFSTTTVKLHTRKLLQTSRPSWAVDRGNVRMKLSIFSVTAGWSNKGMYSCSCAGL